MTLCNRFELSSIVHEVIRGRIWNADDLLLKIAVAVYEWRSDESSRDAARSGFDACIEQVKAGTIDTFSLPQGLYYFVVYDEKQARGAIQTLQSHGLFDGEWFKPEAPSTPPSTEPHPPEPAADSQPELKAVMHPFLMCVAAAFMVILITLVVTWLTLPKRLPGLTQELHARIRIGLYSWPGMFPGWWAAQRNKDEFDVKIEEKLSDLFRKNYHVIAIPLTAMPAMLEYSDWKDARIVRILERSVGSDHLYRRSRVNVSEIYANGAKIQCPRGSFSETLLKDYLDHAPAVPFSDHPRYTTEESSSKLVENVRLDVTRYSVVALPDPAAALMPLGPDDGFVEIPENSLADHQALENSQLIALVAHENELKKPIRRSMIEFVKAWTGQGDNKLRDLRTRSGKEIIATGFPLYKNVSEYYVEKMVRRVESTGDDRNIEFFYGCAIHGCRNSLKSLGVDSDSFDPDNVCGSMLAEIWPGETRSLRRGIESILKSHPDGLCSYDRNLKVVTSIFGFGLNNTELSKVGDLEKAKIPTKLESDHYYCVVGYGDEKGQDEANGKIGKGRAESVAEKLKGLVPNGHLLVIPNKSDRRGQLVEIMEYSPPVPQ